MRVDRVRVFFAVGRRALDKRRDLVLLRERRVENRPLDLRLRLRLRVSDLLLKKRVLLRASRRETLRFHKLFPRRRLTFAVDALLAQIVRVEHEIAVLLGGRDAFRARV